MTRTRAAVAPKSMFCSAEHRQLSLVSLRVQPRVIEGLLGSKSNEPAANLLRCKSGTLVETRRFFAQRLNLSKPEGLSCLICRSK